jgi:hypothetical protein
MREALTGREQRVLMHLRKAQEMEVSIAEYARSFELDVNELYSTRQRLVRKGALSARSGMSPGKPKELSRSGEFVAVRLAASTPPSTSGYVCRIRHPAGLVIECACWPSGAWMQELLSGAGDAAA